MILDPEFVRRCYAINQRYGNIHGFGNPDSQILHGISEFVEFADVLRNKIKDGKHKYGEPGSPEYLRALEDEAADIFLVTMATYGLIGFGHEHIERIVNRKLAILEERCAEWERMTKNNSVMGAKN